MRLIREVRDNVEFVELAVNRVLTYWSPGVIDLTLDNAQKYSKNIQ